MKKPVWIGTILTAGMICIMITACSQPATPSVKQARLIAAENIQLQKDVAGLRNQIEQLKQQHEQKVQSLEDKLVESQKDKQLWQDKAKQNIKEQVQIVLNVILEQNNNLSKENEVLKIRIEELEGTIKKENEPADNPEPVLKERFIYP